MGSADLTLGQKVTVNENYQYWGDYQGEVWTVIGLDLIYDGSVGVTIAMDHGDGWDSPTDGFRPEQLSEKNQ